MNAFSKAGRVRYAPVAARRCRTGSVLILSLWVLFFLAALVVAVGGYVSSALLAAERLTSRVQARSLAESGAAQAAAVIMRHAARTNAWDGLAAEAWNRNAEAFSAEVSDTGRFVVEFITDDEGGEPLVQPGVLGEESRIHLNEATPDLLAALFAVVDGSAEMDTAALAEAVVTRREGTGYEGDTVDDTVLTPSPASGYYANVEGLLLLEGMTLEFFERVSPYVTVYGSARLNVNSVSRVVLEAMGRAGGLKAPDAAAAALRIMAARDEARGFKTPSDVRDVLRGVLGEEDFSKIFRWGFAVQSTAFWGMAQRRLDDEGEPPEIRVEFVWDTVKREFVMWREW